MNFNVSYNGDVTVIIKNISVVINYGGNNVIRWEWALIVSRKVLYRGSSASISLHMVVSQ